MYFCYTDMEIVRTVYKAAYMHIAISPKSQSTSVDKRLQIPVIPEGVPVG